MEVAAPTIPLPEQTEVCYQVNEGVNVAESRKTRFVAAEYTHVPRIQWIRAESR